GAITIVFGALWLADLSGHPIAHRPAAAPPAAALGPPRAARHHEPQTTTRTGFLSLATLGLGGVIGALVSIPPIFLALIPPFLKQNKKPVDVGPISQFPQGQWVITNFLLVPAEGAVSRRTAYIRNNGFLGKQPSFTIISNRCAHLGC